jgi:hypothetical protein
MSELKTLNIIEEENNLSSEDSLISKRELKKAAIEWIKYLESKNVDEVTSKYFPLIFDKFEPQAEVNSVVGFIKHFFNITEEDLK